MALGLQHAGPAHQYVVPGRGGLPAAWHDWFVDQIGAHGYRAKFGRAWFTYMELDGWKYWVAGRIIINRERLG